MTDLEKAARKALEALEGLEALLLSMGLTHLIVYGYAEKAITNLQEALAEQPAPVPEAHKQEPLFWYKPYPNGMYNGPIHNAQIGDVLRGSEEWTPLYTNPPQRTFVGLTDEEIKIIWRDIDGNDGMLMRFARAIEAAHGIKGDA